MTLYAEAGARDAVGVVRVQRAVEIPANGLRLPGDLCLPEDPVGLVLFAHGSGSSRLSPRNTAVARALNDQRLGTLLFDLLVPSEMGDRSNVFDVPLLAARLEAATAWVMGQDETRSLPLGYFGASTGAAAALWAAADLPEAVSAIVSRGGRPDLAVQRLPSVRAPTMLIVGERDPQVLQLNRLARRDLRGTSMIEIVPGATHLFEEPGALDAVTDIAARWFLAHLSLARRRARNARNHNHAEHG